MFSLKQLKQLCYELQFLPILANTSLDFLDNCTDHSEQYSVWFHLSFPLILSEVMTASMCLLYVYFLCWTSTQTFVSLKTKLSYAKICICVFHCCTGEINMVLTFVDKVSQREKLQSLPWVMPKPIAKFGCCIPVVGGSLQVTDVGACFTPQK